MDSNDQITNITPTGYTKFASKNVRDESIRRSVQNQTFEVAAQRSDHDRHVQTQHLMSAQELTQRFIDQVYQQDIDHGTVSTFISQKARDRALAKCVLQNSSEIAAWDFQKQSNRKICSCRLTPSNSSTLIKIYPAWSITYNMDAGHFDTRYDNRAKLVLNRGTAPNDTQFGFRIKTFYSTPDSDAEKANIDLTQYVRETEFFKKEAYPLERAFLLTASNQNAPTTKARFFPEDNRLRVRIKDRVYADFSEDSNKRLKITLGVPRKSDRRKEITIEEFAEILDMTAIENPSAYEYIQMVFSNYEWADPNQKELLQKQSESETEIRPELQESMDEARVISYDSQLEP